MKKLKYLLFGVAGLLMASCSQDDFESLVSDGNGNYNLTVTLPGQSFGSRAFGDGTTAENLYVAIYDYQDGNLIEALPVKTFEGNLSTTVSLTLAQGKRYNVAFFAQSVASAEKEVYNFDTENAKILVDYDAMSDAANYNTDAYDCFFWLEDTGVIGNENIQKSVTLYRPVAQINWGTDDLSTGAITAENNYGPKANKLVSKVTTHAYTSFDVLKGDVDRESFSDVTLDYLARPQNEDFPVKRQVYYDEYIYPYEYLSMHYLLVPQDVDVIDLTLTVNKNDKIDPEDVTEAQEIKVSAAPVEANHRTNIFGSLLTNTTEYEVIKEKIFDTPENHVTTNGKSLVDALEQGGYVILNEDIELSHNYAWIDKKVVLDLNGHNINYSYPDHGALYVATGGDLTIRGEGTIQNMGQDEDGDSYILVWNDGGKTTIEGGNFRSQGPGCMVYSTKGTIYVKGGSYYLEGTEPNKTYYYPLNCYDSSYREGTADIEVTGGLFYNWDPNFSNSEGSANADFVPDGYQSVEMTLEDGTTWYQVVPEGTTPVSATTPQDTFYNGGNIILAEDYDYTGGTKYGLPYIMNNTNLNLNGNTLTSTNSSKNAAVMLIKGTTTISNGVVKPSFEQNNESATIYVYPQNSQAINLTLENITVTGAHPVYVNNTNPGTLVTINSGTYYSDFQGCEAIYVQKGGKVVINGGTFGQPGVTYDFLLNIKDDFRQTLADPRDALVVNGGTFINFNPAECGSEGYPTNFVADGCKVSVTHIGADTYYTVVK